MLTIADIARRIGRDYSVVYTWFRRGKLPTPTVAEGRVRLWSEGDIDKWWGHFCGIEVDNSERKRFTQIAAAEHPVGEGKVNAVEQRLWTQSDIARRFGKSVASVNRLIPDTLVPDHRTQEGFPLFSDDCVERAIANSPRLQKWQRDAEDRKAGG